MQVKLLYIYSSPFSSKKFFPRGYKIIYGGDVFKSMYKKYYQTENRNNSDLSSTLPILNKMLEAYKKWQMCMISIPKIYRYSLGLRIDNLFLDVIENIILSLSSGKESKFDSLNYVSVKLDLLKFLLKISWEVKIVNDKKYIDLSLSVDEVGRMLGGWIKNTKKVT